MPATVGGSGEVRVLPFRVRPLPDEPFDSWVEAMAAAHGATMNETGFALGLIDQREGVAAATTSWMANGWATELTDAQTRRLEDATGILAAEFHEMTRMRFARHAIQYTRQGRISVRCPAGGTSGRYCPECLADSGGRWRMSWQFPFGFACPRHNRILVDTCPGCGQPPRRIGHPLALVPVPGLCHNPGRGARTGPIADRCRTNLTAGIPTLAAGVAVLSAQRRMMRIVATDRASFGIYAGAPQPAIPALEDIRLLARMARIALAADDPIDTSGVDAELLDLVRRQRPETGWTGATTAVGAAVGNAIAVTALADADMATDLLRGRIATSTSYTQHTPQVQTLVATALGRSRRPTAFLQSATATADPVQRARKVPALLWDEWMACHAPHRRNQAIAASAFAAAVVFTGTRLTHAAALALLDPAAPPRRVTQMVRELGRAHHETDTLHALLRLVDYLDTHDVPIDYARRRTLDCTELLTPDRWADLCRDLNVRPGAGPRWALARATLHQTVTGGAPATPHDPAEPVPSPIEIRAFSARLPVAVRDALAAEGRRFLAEHRIDEPLTWTPPLDPEPGTEHAAPATPPAPWASARPVRGALTSQARVAADYAGGVSTYALAAREGVSRQTVSRALAASGQPTRRGRPVRLQLDIEHLRHLYETERRSTTEIAAAVGCSAMTVSRRLHAAGVLLRPRGGPHPLPPSTRR
ncbi:TniQ family protein [uncultured Microbacterium sp.]|uniref:TniQ family protein n=1 Tax=uncultured Microbacterium sp. TaxID=191216 RepID=UPI0025CF7CB9|nr:TniQ family protein [uncultured Microbacterium sp.]